MFEYEGTQFSLQDLKNEAVKRGLGLDDFIKKMEKLGMKSTSINPNKSLSLYTPSQRKLEQDNDSEISQILKGLPNVGSNTVQSLVNVVTKDLPAAIAQNFRTVAYDELYDEEELKKLKTLDPNGTYEDPMGDPTGFKTNAERIKYLEGYKYSSAAKQEQKINKYIVKKYKELEVYNKYLRKDTGEGIVKGVKQGDASDIVLGVFNAGAGMAETVIPSMLTGGWSLPFQITAPMFTRYNQEKAETIYGKDDPDAVAKLLKNREDEIAIPATLGLMGSAFEYVGYKGVTNYMLGKTAKGRVASLLLTGNKEGITELGQSGLDEVNIALAQGKQGLDVGKAFIDGIFSEKGLESYLQGFIGGTGMSAGGRAINRALRSDKASVKELNGLVNNLAELNVAKNSAINPTAKEAIEVEIKKAEQALSEYVTDKRKIADILNEDQKQNLINAINEKDNITSKVESLKNLLKNNEISSKEFGYAIESLNNQDKTLTEQIETINESAKQQLLVTGLEAAKEEGDAVGLKQKLFETKEEYAALFGEKNSKEYNEALKADGHISDDGQTYFVNMETARQTGAISVGSHELLHGIIGKSFSKLSTEAKTKLNKNFLDLLSKKDRQTVLNRLASAYGITGDKVFTTEELYTAFSDVIIDGNVTFNEGVFGKVKNAFENILRQLSSAGYFAEESFLYRKEFGNSRQAYNFVKDYSLTIKKTGKVTERAKKFAKVDPGATKVKKSMTASQKAKVEAKVDKLGQVDTDGNNLQEKGTGNFYYQADVDNVIKKLRKKRTDEELGLENEGYLDNLIASKYKIRPVPEAFVSDVFNQLLPDIKGFNPEENNSLFGYLGPRIKFRAGDVYKKIYEKKGPKKTVSVEERTKEGEVRIQLEADIDSAMEAFETEDLSIQGQAKKNKAKKQRYSQLRQEMGFKREVLDKDGNVVEEGDKIHKEVLESAKKSLIIAYGATQNITDVQLRAKAVAEKIKKEYNNLDSPLFKQIKNFLTYGIAENKNIKGEKIIYLNQLEKFRVAIVENVSTADFVQMQRNDTQEDKIFLNFVKQVTKKDEVIDLIKQERLPPSALNTITKDKKTGEGSNSVPLYEKIMPSPMELKSWADQPLVNPDTGRRSGLKGTRKDGIVKRVVNSLVTDAIMEARQSEEVQSKIAEMGIDPGSVAELGAAIGKEVGVKFSKSNAIGDVTAAIDGAGDVGVYSQIKFSKSHREAYEKQLNKRRPDLTEDQRKNAVQSVFDFVDGKNIPNNKKSKYEKMAMHYTANGYLILPEDGYKVIEAEKIATQKKLDPFSFKNPNVLIETYVGEVKGTRTNPDNVKTFTNKTELSNGVTVYNVEDSKQGQLDTRKVIDTHFGKKANPWCLCARRGEYYSSDEAHSESEMLEMKKDHESLGRTVTVTTYKSKGGTTYDGINIKKGQTIWELTIQDAFEKGKELEAAFKLWKNYNKEGNGHQIAFQNGRLVAFRDGKKEPRWWDRNDNPTSGVVVRGKKGKDGFKPVIEVGKNKETILAYEKVTGDKKNGTTIEKDLDGTVVLQETKKDGKLDGVKITVKKVGAINAGSSDYSSMQTENYKDGRRLDFKEERTYTNKKATVKTSFGKDEITLNNITKYERSFQDSKDNIRLPDNEVTTIEGTVSQRYFEEFNNPSLADEFTKTNLKYLTPAHERYYGIQGQKVEVVSNFEIADRKLEDVQTGKTTTVTINGVKQENRVRFSKSDVKFSRNSKNITNLMGPNQINKARKNIGIEIDQAKKTLTEDHPAIEILETIYNNIKPKTTFEQIVDVSFAATNHLHNNDIIMESSIVGVDIKGAFTKEHVKQILGTAKAITEIGLGGKAFNSLLNIIENKVSKSKDKGKTLATEIQRVSKDKRTLDWLFFKESKYTGEKGATSNEKFFNAYLKPIIKKHNIKGFSVVQSELKGKKITKINYKGEDIASFQSNSKLKSNLKNSENVSGTLQELTEQNSKNRKHVLDIIKDDNISKDVKKGIVGFYATDTNGLLRNLSNIGIMFEGYKGKTELDHRPTIIELRKKINKTIDNPTQSNIKELENTLENSYISNIPLGLHKKLNEPGENSKKTTGDISVYSEYVDQYTGKDIKIVNPNGLKFSKSQDFQTINKAVQFSRSANNSTKGITVLDFDDTLATTKSMIRFTRPDGTKGKLNAEQYASTYEDLSNLGYEFDFSEFNKVVDGKTAPLFEKAMKLQGKFGPENMFVLTARPAESAVAIHAFLKANGLNIPLKNITGLANSTSEAKALWVADKVGEGFNDFYFADDALQNVQAVKNMLDQFDVKSKVQQAKVKFSKSMNDQFNDILENVTGIESKKRFSIIKGRKRGESKGKFRYFVPPSHEDFVGLLYNFMGRGKEGNKHRDFLEQALVRPLNRANRELDTARQSVANDYKALNKQFEDVKSKLTKKTPDGDFVFQDAIRVYLWDKHGHKIPGLSETDQKKLSELVMSDPQLQAYAENLNVISKQENYVAPTEGWNSGDIRMDLDDATGRIGRGQHFAEFIENSDIIFSEENLNKIEAGYGKEVRESLEDILYRIETGRNRPTGQNAQVNKLMNYLNGSVGTVMFFNMRSALLQQMSIVNYINFADNNIFAAAKAFANQKQYWADWSFIFNSDMLKQRRGGIQTDVNGADLAASLRNSKDISRKLVSKLLELGFLPTQIGDNIAIATGGATYYRNRINKYIKQGMSKKEAEAAAFTDFQDITQSTQQSARPDMVSKQQASVIGKVILNFQNVTSQFNRLGKKAFQDIYNRRITKPNKTQMQSDISNASRITYYFAVQNAIFYTLQTALFAMMFDDDEEDNNNLFLKKRERLINGSIDSVLRGSGLIGGVVATLKNVAIAFARQRDVKYNPDESAVMLEALNLSPVLGIKGRKIVNAEKTLNYNKKVIDEMETFDIDNPQWSAVTNYTEALTNVPLNRLYNKTQNVRQALNNEHAAWERTLMFLGWSQYNLDLENKKMEEIKEKTKSKKKKGKSKVKTYKVKEYKVK